MSLKALIGKLDGWWQSLGLVFGIALGLEALGLAVPRFNQYMIDDVLMSDDRSLRDLLTLGLILLVLAQSALSLSSAHPPPFPTP